MRAAMLLLFLIGSATMSVEAIRSVTEEGPCDKPSAEAIGKEDEKRALWGILDETSVDVEKNKGKQKVWQSMDMNIEEIAKCNKQDVCLLMKQLDHHHYLRNQQVLPDDDQAWYYSAYKLKATIAGRAQMSPSCSFGAMSSLFKEGLTQSSCARLMNYRGGNPDVQQYRKIFMKTVSNEWCPQIWASQKAKLKTCDVDRRGRQKTYLNADACEEEVEGGTLMDIPLTTKPAVKLWYGSKGGKSKEKSSCETLEEVCENADATGALPESCDTLYAREKSGLDNEECSLLLDDLERTGVYVKPHKLTPAETTQIEASEMEECKVPKTSLSSMHRVGTEKKDTQAALETAGEQARTDYGVKMDAKRQEWAIGDKSMESCTAKDVCLLMKQLDFDHVVRQKVENLQITAADRKSAGLDKLDEKKKKDGTIDDEFFKYSAYKLKKPVFEGFRESHSAACSFGAMAQLARDGRTQSSCANLMLYRESDMATQEYRKIFMDKMSNDWCPNIWRSSVERKTACLVKGTGHIAATAYQPAGANSKDKYAVTFAACEALGDQKLTDYTLCGAKCQKAKWYGAGGAEITNKLPNRPMACNKVWRKCQNIRANLAAWCEATGVKDCEEPGVCQAFEVSEESGLDMMDCKRMRQDLGRQEKNGAQSVGAKTKSGKSSGKQIQEDEGTCNAPVVTDHSDFDAERLKYGILREGLGAETQATLDEVKTMCTKKDVCLMMAQLDLDYYERTKAANDEIDYTKVGYAKPTAQANWYFSPYKMKETMLAAEVEANSASCSFGAMADLYKREMTQSSCGRLMKYTGEDIKLWEYRKIFMQLMSNEWCPSIWRSAIDAGNTCDAADPAKARAARYALTLKACALTDDDDDKLPAEDQLTGEAGRPPAWDMMVEEE